MQNDTLLHNERFLKFIAFFSCFSFFEVFYFRIHPLMLTDTDDWRYALYFREAIPSIKLWNPCRILAEVTMPLVSKVAMYCIYPILGDAFIAISFCYATFIAIVLTALGFIIWHFYEKERKCSQFDCFCIFSFFFLAHFWIFRKYSTSNDYMLRAQDTCCYFYYVIPNLINSIFVILYRRKREDVFKSKLSVVFFYFCVFSNIWASVITTSYIGSVLINRLLRMRKNDNLRGYITSNKTEIVIIVVWAVAQIMEMLGGRAEHAFGGSYSENLLSTLNFALYKIGSIDVSFIISTALLIVISTIVFRNSIVDLLLAGTLNLLYCLVTCAKVCPSYISRPDVFYGVFFFYILMSMDSLEMIIKENEKLKVLLPLFLVIIFCHIDTVGKTFIESSVMQLEPESVDAINHDIIDQIIKADVENKDEIILHVPKFETDDNWPYGNYAGDRFAEFAYEYGISEKYIRIQDIIPSVDKNTLIK